MVKIDPTQGGSGSLVYATYLGGWDWDSGNAIAVDAYGNAWITGETRSTYSINPPGFPVTGSAFQSDLAIQNYADTHCDGTIEVETCEDMFVAGVSLDGTQLLYSTYLGGSGNDSGKSIAIDASERIYIGGQSCGINFPITANATQTASQSCGTGAFLIIDPTQSGAASLVYSTYLGGSGGESINGIATNGAGTVYVAGSVNSTDFPLVNPLPGQNAGGGSSSSGFISIFSVGDLFAH